MQRDCSTASPPAHVQGCLKRVMAIGRAGPSSSASAQVRPPSVETSTRRTAPLPDQAKPTMVWWPRPARRWPPAGYVITDFGPCSQYEPSGVRSRRVNEPCSQYVT